MLFQIIMMTFDVYTMGQNKCTKSKTYPEKDVESRYFYINHPTSYPQPLPHLFIDVSFDIGTFAGQAMLQSDRALPYRGSFLM